jgi:predicted DCC family thiol-disulfide oxidoreductase YuxK
MGPGQGLTYLFYDGDCGICRGAAGFTAKRDASHLIHFAPLGGVTFKRLVPLDLRTGLPDSLVVLTPGGGLLTRSGAVIHLLHRMGPIWRLVGVLLAWIPARPRDWVYDLVARQRPSGGPCPSNFASGDPRFKP